MGRLLRIVDHVNQCYSNADGEVIKRILIQNLDIGERVIVSFEDIDSASSSFINSAFIELLEHYNFDYIKSHLGFANTTRTLNENIKRRFTFEVNNRKNLVEA